MVTTNEKPGRLRPLFGLGSVVELELPRTDVEELGTGFDVGAIATEDWKEKRLDERAAEKAEAEHRASRATRRGVVGQFELRRGYRGKARALTRRGLFRRNASGSYLALELTRALARYS